MAIVALQAFFENLGILHDDKQEGDEVSSVSLTSSSSSSCSSSSSSSSASSSSSSSRSNCNDEGPKNHDQSMCVHVVCDNARIPTRTLLREQHRKRQVQQLQDRRTRRKQQQQQQHRPIYNRSISVNSFASSSSSSSAAVSSKWQPHSRQSSRHRREDDFMRTPNVKNGSHLNRTHMMARWAAPQSVLMDVPYLLSPTPLSPNDPTSVMNAWQLCDTPTRSNNRSSSSSISTTRSTIGVTIAQQQQQQQQQPNDDHLSSRRHCRGMMEAPFLLSPIVTNQTKKVVPTATVSPRSARWSFLIRQESDSALIRPSRTKDLFFS
jgi:hypothetical protein